ncbi:MAG TPA: hypothetical protein VHG71_02165 [Verrucomicrobiae bacterium]|nr:hypothetical protein [Verrucomicrobiae bacterium]
MKKFIWICEFCFRTTSTPSLPSDWDFIFQSAVCPDCKPKVETGGGYHVVKGGAFAGRRKDPRALKGAKP